MEDSQMKLLWVSYWALLAVLAGCQVQPVNQELPSSISSSSTPLISQSHFTTSPAPQQDGLPTIIDPLPSITLEHDTESFTQGLLFFESYLYESTGRNGQSQLRRLDPHTGKILAKVDLDPENFGEGLASLDHKLYQLTWQNGVCFIYDTASLQLLSKLFYPFEGWGLTTDPQKKQFIFSDGSAELRFLDPHNFTVRRRIQVLDGRSKPVTMLNELEWVRGEIWANVWMSDQIARIDPQTGQIKGWIRFPQLVQAQQHGQEDVLNGIAYDPNSDRLWVTGKLWSKIYRFDHIQKVFFSQANPDHRGSHGNDTPARVH